MTDTTKAAGLRDQFAAKLHGSEYGKEGSRELWAEMREAGYVAVFGASDDLMEFQGAISDEIGAYEGTVAYVTPAGLHENHDECCRHAERANAEAMATAVPIKAVWDAGDGTSWSYETSVPHSTFEVMEDGEVYCRGIVFALSDAAIRLATLSGDDSAEKEGGGV